MSAKAPFETHHHITPVRYYVFTIIALVVLMVMTVEVAWHPFGDLGPISGTLVNQFVALAIAITKATLVVMIFMGVRWSTSLTKFWAMLGFVWLAFFTIMAGDYGTRKYEKVQGWEKNAESALPRQVGEFEELPRDPNDVNVRPRQ